MSNNTPQGYKESALGIIPANWEVKRLGEISEINPGKGNFKDTEVSFIAMADVSEEGKVLNETTKKLS